MALANLKTGFLNVNGFVGQKTYDPEFNEILEKFDILCLTETWHSNKECIEKVKKNLSSNFLYFQNARKNKHKRSKRNSGGIIIFYRKHLHRHITVQDKNTENMLWIKLNKILLNLDQDLCIGTVYNSPINSSYTKTQESDFYFNLQEKMTTFSPNDYIIIGGDFNARTGVLPDYIHENHKDINFLNLPESYNIDKFTKTRNNQDLHINSYGEKLIDVTISTKLRILNGRTLGDLMGKFTYTGYNGVSVVDYILASENFIMKNYIHSFSIEALTTLSDHRPLNLKLNYILSL